MSETIADFGMLSQWNLSGYHFRSLLGQGGMGTVYLAEDETLKRQVAIKVISDQIPRGSESYARFVREAKMMATVEHPHVVRLYSFGEIDQRAYFIMEYVQGESLSKMIEKRGRLNLEESLLFLQQIVEALEAAWEKQVIHRDIKPSNVLIDRRFQVRVADFGLAKLIETSEDSSLTQSGQIMGTPAYISPEQIVGQEIDFRSDIYSLGIVFYEMLIGERPFKAPTPMGVVAKQLNESLPSLRLKRSELPESVGNLIQWMTQKDPTKRPASYVHLLQRIHAVIRDPNSEFKENSGLDTATTPKFYLDSKPNKDNKTAKLLSKIYKSKVVFFSLIFGMILGIGITLSTSKLRSTPKAKTPISFRYLTYSGQDTEPSSSPDSRFVTFVSRRGQGLPRVWIKDISSGEEKPLSSGPDRFPRFSPNGAFVLFTRATPTGFALYRVSVLGGEPRELITNGENSDWSPDGKKITFIQNKIENNDAISLLMTASADGNDIKMHSRIQNKEYMYPRWSPDGRFIAVRESIQYGNLRTSIKIFNLDRKVVRTILSPVNGDISSVFWSGTQGDLGYMLFDSRFELRLSTGKLVLENESGIYQEGPLGVFNAVAQTSDIVDKGSLVFEESLRSQNLKEMPLGKKSGGNWLSRGHSEDRQPVFSPDGEWVLFTSNRSGNLDLWKISKQTGSLIRITEDDAEDYDPAFSPDGKSILWSSSRSGNFEIWIADQNGTSPKQVSHDGKDAENPTMTPDRNWIAYTSYHPYQPGVWKVHPDGSGATKLFAGHTDLPEVSPDGKYVLYRTQVEGTQRVRVLELKDGNVVPFEIVIDYDLNSGRARWLPNEKAIAFTGLDENGVMGIFIQDFVPGQDTKITRRKLSNFDNLMAESFGISPDGNSIVASLIERASNLVLAEGVPLLLPRSKRITN